MHEDPGALPCFIQSHLHHCNLCSLILDSQDRTSQGFHLLVNCIFCRGCKCVYTYALFIELIFKEILFGPFQTIFYGRKDQGSFMLILLYYLGFYYCVPYI